MSVFLVLSVSALAVCAGDAAAGWPSLHRVETGVKMIIECMCVAFDEYLNQREPDCLRIVKVCWCVYFGLSSNTVTIFLFILQNTAHIWGLAFAIYACVDIFTDNLSVGLSYSFPSSDSVWPLRKWLCGLFAGRKISCWDGNWIPGEHIIIMAHIALKSIGGSTLVGFCHFTPSEVVAGRLKARL